MFPINSKIYLILGIVLIVGIVSGFWLGSSTKNQAYQMGLEKGRAEVEQEYQKKIEQIFPSAREPEEIFSVSGEILEIKDKLLSLRLDTTWFNPFKEPEVEIKSVRISDNTTLVKQIPDPLAAVLDPQSVSPYREIAIDFSELQKGDRITVEAGENIKGKTEFEATKITLVAVY